LNSNANRALESGLGFAAMGCRGASLTAWIAAFSSA
jgi:hypothetical protein